jgi:hypothetical protein
MERTSFDIFVEAASESPKLVGLLLNAQQVQLESASSEAVKRLHEQVGTNAFKKPAVNIHDVASDANVDPGKSHADAVAEDAFRTGRQPDLQVDGVGPAEPVADPLSGTEETPAGGLGLGDETTVDIPDEDGVIDNPSDETIDDFCAFLGEN